MKKITRLTALFLCCLLLSGCATPDVISHQINSIGTVTLTSGDAIALAEENYNSLFAPLQRLVDNYQILQDARSRYDTMVATQEALTEEADRIGVVTVESGAALESLRKSYDTAIRNCVPETFDVFEARLIGMEEQFEQCVINEEFSAAQELYNQKSYDRAIEALDRLLNNPKAEGYYTKCNSLIRQCREGLVAQAVEKSRELVKEGKLFDAMQLLDSISIDYMTDDYWDAREEATSALEANRPKNGKVLKRTLKSGRNVLKVTAEDRDFIVKLESKSSGKYVLFYVRDGKTATIKVPDGSYILKYGSGEYWCDSTNYFYPAGSFSKSPETAVFKSTSGTYTQIKVTVYVTTGFGISNNQISQDEF